MSNKWEESIKKIHQKDEFELEGIKAWHISMHEMVPNSECIRSQLLRAEAIKLVSCGFGLAFNTEHGTGDISVTDDGLTIKLWQDGKKTEIYKKTLDEVIDWLIYFYEN